MSNSIEVVTLVGRIVQGHPIRTQPVTDDRTGQPKTNAAGEPRRRTFFALAIPKGTEQAWWETQWGNEIAQFAMSEWKNGAWQQPSFSWKIEDGDSTVPNKVNVKNCDREGFPGHWIIKLQTEIGCRCFPAGRYDMAAQIRDENAIKTGDYGRAIINVKSNESTQTAGMYLSPSVFELVQSGVEIVTASSGPDAAALFGAAGAAQMPQGAQVQSTPQMPQIGAAPQQPQMPQMGAAPQQPAMPQMGAAPQQPAMPQMGAAPQQPQMPQMGAASQQPAMPQMGGIQPQPSFLNPGQ